MASTLDVNDSNRRQPQERVTHRGADLESYKERLTRAAGIETVVVEKEYEPLKHLRQSEKV